MRHSRQRQLRSRQRGGLAASRASKRGALWLALFAGPASCGISDPSPQVGGCTIIPASGIEGDRTVGLTIIAHRGLGGCFPENTLESVRGAISMGFDAVELDVQLTMDSTAVLMHDSTVNRTTNGSGHVAKLSLGQLKKLDACPTQPTPCVVPTLAEALAAGGPEATFLLDMKGPFPSVALARMVDEIAQAGALGRTRLLTGSLPLLRRIRLDHPTVPTAFVYFPSRNWKQWYSSILPGLSKDGVRTFVMFVSDIIAYPQAVQALRAADVEIVAATIYAREELERVSAAGVRSVLADQPIER